MERGAVLEKLGMVDWAIPRDKLPFNHGWYTPRDVVKQHLAESYETPDPLIIIFKIRGGIHWHDKAPMNGRELTADDVVFNFRRFTGLGSGFTEKSPNGGLITSLPIESIEATDGHTFVVKLKQISFTALDVFLYDSFEGGWIYPPEVINEHGNVQDWRNLVGTGPYELVDWVEGSSRTYTKNFNYWKDDEKFPGNRLPYSDELKILYMPDASTRLAALRTGKVALLGGIGEALNRDDAESLQRTDPELVITTTIFGKSNTSAAMDVRKPPFDDLRVRQAMQLAIDNEAINEGLYGGLGVTTPQGTMGTATLGFHVPYEEWPEEVKANYGYSSPNVTALTNLLHTLRYWIRMGRGNGKRRHAKIAAGSQDPWVIRRLSPFVDGMSSTTSIGMVLTSEDALISDWMKLGEDMHTSAWVILGTSDDDDRSRSTRASHPPSLPSQLQHSLRCWAPR